MHRIYVRWHVTRKFASNKRTLRFHGVHAIVEANPRRFAAFEANML